MPYHRRGGSGHGGSGSHPQPADGTSSSVPGSRLDGPNRPHLCVRHPCQQVQRWSPGTSAGFDQRDSRDIWLDIVHHALVRFDIDLSLIFYDLTAFVVHGAYSEQKVGLSSRCDGCPYGHTGRTTDCITFSKHNSYTSSLVPHHTRVRRAPPKPQSLAMNHMVSQTGS
jgi:hypothetical protein